VGRRTPTGRTFDQEEPPLPPVDQLRRLDRHPLALHRENIGLGVKMERTVESEVFLTFVKYPAPKGPDQVIISVFRDMIDKEFHRDQIEGSCPPLVKLPWKSKKVPPVSAFVTQSTTKIIIEGNEATADSPL